jgi:hypothetical protein
MKKIFLPLFLLISVNVFCQMQEFTIRDFYTQIGLIIQEADEAIPDETDPYGFHLSVRIVSKYNGSFTDVFSPETIKQSVDKVISKHNFGRFNLGKAISYKINEEKKYINMQVGLTPLNAADEEMAFQFKNFKVTQRLDKQVVTHIVIVIAHFIIEKPNDGIISGNVYFQGTKGQEVLNDHPFLSSGNEKKIAIQRFGPGADKVNSGEPDDLTWKPFENNQSGYNFGELTPGHYFPHVKINGCIHHFDLPEKNNKDEVIIKTYGEMRWDKDHSNDKVLRFDKLKAETKDKIEIHTTFSTQNIIEGFLLAPNQSPDKWNRWRDSVPDFVKKEEVVVLKAKMKVFLEPYLWQSTFTFPRKVETADGYFKFENLPSGVYILYLENQKGRGKIVEVCNCNKDGYEKSPNMTYQQNINTDGYDIYLDYSFENDGETFNVKAKWSNIIIAFGNDTTTIQKFSAESIPLQDTAQNYLDIRGNIIQPPFTMMDYPEYTICADEFRICSNFLQTGNSPPADFSITKSGKTFSNINIKPDFDNQEGLYNQFTVEEYKRDITLQTSETVKAGVYFTWQFRFFTKVGNDKGPDLHIESSPAFQWFQDHSEGILPPTNIFGGGFVDALVPQDVIGLIHLGKNFTFSKNLKGGVKYTIRGEIENKTKNKNTAPLEGEW